MKSGGKSHYWKSGRVRVSLLLTGALASGGLLWAGLADAQTPLQPQSAPGPGQTATEQAATEQAATEQGSPLQSSKLSLAGQTVDSVRLYGAEYVRQTELQSLLRVWREGPLVRIEGLGHVLYLPIDEDQQRSTTDFNTVQLDTERVKARTATFLNGAIYIPVDTVARGLGAEYQPGSLKVGVPTLQAVSSRAGKDADRIVLDLNRDVEIVDEQRGATAVVTLRGVKGDAQKYTTRGVFVPAVTMTRQGDDLQLTFPLTAASGLRTYKVIRPGSVRVIVDAGPGIPRNSPALLARVTRPLVVLDPAKVPGVGRDVTLEVARRAGELLTKAGWQVRVTRDSASAMPLNDKLTLTRQSDVYLALDLGRLPGSPRGGVTVYEQSGRSSSQFVNAIRNGSANPPYGVLAVGNTGNSRKLADLLRGELRGSGVNAGQESTSRVLTLREAPQAALLFELGWASNASDLANLRVNDRLDIMAVSLARSVATYLTARANNNANLTAEGVKP